MREELYSLSLRLLLILIVSVSAYFLGMAAAQADTFTCNHFDQEPLSIGTGGTSKEAWKNMINHCVNQQTAAFEKRSGNIIPEDRYLLFIDSCINRKCTQIIKETK